MINRDVFFRAVRQPVFGGSLTVGQVDGMEKIIDYWQTKWSKMPLDEFAYLLATVAHETGYKMKPVKEAGGERYLRSKKYYPYVGVGLIQATWARNWQRLGIKSVEDGLQWPSALHAAFYGMAAGIYTGKKLADYIGHGRRDYVNARRIINGTDRAQDIANHALSFRLALLKAQEAIPAPLDTKGLQPVPMPSDTKGLDAVADYDQFREWLLKALREDQEVKDAVIALVFPEEPVSEADPMDEPYEDNEQEGVAYADDNDQLDLRYG